MKTPSSVKKLAKFLDYILGRHPDEFGLVPDRDGFVKIKDLLKALNEEDGWRHVRRGHLDEIRVTVPSAPIEIRENRIRAVDRRHLPRESPAENPPKLLYTCVRVRAHAHVIERGISPPGDTRIILSSDRELALRIGRRLDRQPVLLTVQVAHALESGVIFYRSGESLFLTDYIPVGCFTAPPLPKLREEPPGKRSGEKPAAPKQPGSFPMRPRADWLKEKPDRRERKKKEADWKKDRRRIRQKKQQGWRE